MKTDVGDVCASVVVRRSALVRCPYGCPRLMRHACRRQVVATNGWTAELLPELKPHLHATRNQVIMTPPLEGSASWGVGGLSVDDGAKELYAIRRPDGRVCLGGARAIEPDAAVGNSDDASLCPEVGRARVRTRRCHHSTLKFTPRSAAIPTRSSPRLQVGAYLRQFLSEHFPALGFSAGAPVDAEWTGVLGFTSDGRPICGALPGRPGVLVAAGFCGHGMPQCFGVGKDVALMAEETLRRGMTDMEALTPQLHPFISGPANAARFLGE